MNDARKERLTIIANDRLAYQDYLEMLDDLNKQIGSGYQRIVRANHKASAGKKKKGPGQKEGGDAANEATKAKLVMDVPESLVNAIELRRQFKEVPLIRIGHSHSICLISSSAGFWNCNAGVGEKDSR